MKNAVILGASGYTGVEAVRLISEHPHITLTALTGHSRAGQSYGEIYPQFVHQDLPKLTKWEEVNWDRIDVAFACLPHGASQETIAAIRDKVETIIDLSADFRLSDPAVYEEVYGRPHGFTHLLDTAVYGLTEFNRTNIRDADLIACPGCYPTCSLLPLIPALRAAVIDASSIIIDAKSGVTGAGRKTSANLLYSEISDGAHAYGIANHRHAPEIDQIITHISGNPSRVSFTPHLLPMNRGMIATIYTQLAPGKTFTELRSAIETAYADEPFIHCLPAGIVPQTRHVRGTNHCFLNVFEDRVDGRIILISVIDNLTKGSSGQALQNYNLTQGWDETSGLSMRALFP